MRKFIDYKGEACVKLQTTKAKHVYNYRLQRRGMCKIIDEKGDASVKSRITKAMHV